jgi:tRNA (guanosine-2'-O-)-methyltransferase
VLQQRTRHLTFVLENIYQPHNASAVLRSCEISGIQDVHIIENTNSFKPSQNVAMGAAKWLDIYKYNQDENNTVSCIKQLKKHGYRIVATTPHTKDVLLEDLPVEKPLALLFGTELTGLSKTALDNADEFVRIPMHGFTESYNISVSAALCAYQLSRKLHRSDIQWQLTEDEYLHLETEWYRRTIRSSKLLEEEFLRKDNRKK